MTTMASIKLVFASVIFMFCMAQLKALQVKYPRLTVLKEEQDSVVLKCTIQYNKSDCDIPDAMWCRISASNTCIKLTNPSKFLTQLSEQDMEVGKSRLITTEIQNLYLNDSGLYQCTAKCSDINARGHFINLTVMAEDDLNAKIKSPSSCGMIKTDIIHLMFCSIFILDVLIN